MGVGALHFEPAPLIESFHQVAKLVERGQSVELSRSRGDVSKGDGGNALELPADEVFIFSFVFFDCRD